MNELWQFAKAAYLDNPIPSLFKERLFVYLSRFCEVRYCITRHCGFLLGLGRSAGDPSAHVMTITQVIHLLKRPVPNEECMGAALSRLEAIADATQTTFGLGTQLVDALTRQIKATVTKHKLAGGYTVTVTIPHHGSILGSDHSREIH